MDAVSWSQVLECDGPDCEERRPRYPVQGYERWVHVDVRLTFADKGTPEEEGDFCSTECACRWLAREGVSNVLAIPKAPEPMGALR